jgi:hypothetical protein
MEKKEDEPRVGRCYFRYDGKKIVQVEGVTDTTVLWRDELGPGRSSHESFLKLYPTLAAPDCTIPESLPCRERAFTLRDEANALTALAFRNGFLEELHAGKKSPLLEQPELSRITDDEVRRLMIEASEKLSRMLALKECDPARYQREIQDYHEQFCARWQRD